MAQISGLSGVAVSTLIHGRRMHDLWHVKVEEQAKR
jgi:hypothetical protein